MFALLLILACTQYSLFLCNKYILSYEQEKTHLSKQHQGSCGGLVVLAACHKGDSFWTRFLSMVLEKYMGRDTATFNRM